MHITYKFYYEINTTKASFHILDVLKKFSFQIIQPLTVTRSAQTEYSKLYQLLNRNLQISRGS